MNNEQNVNAAMMDDATLETVAGGNIPGGYGTDSVTAKLTQAGDLAYARSDYYWYGRWSKLWEMINAIEKRGDYDGRREAIKACIDFAQGYTKYRTDDIIALLMEALALCER